MTVAKKGADKKKKIGDDDEVPTRQKVREFVEGKYITLLMTFLTLFALFGDDFRLWFFDGKTDQIFFGVLTVSFVLFALEILINSGVLDDFKYSFFFWLDIVATLSLLQDIPFVVDIFYRTIGSDQTNEMVDAIPGEFATVQNSNDKLAKIIKSLRLIRLIRIIKLYKYLVKSNSEAEEARLREQQKLSQNAQQAALKRELEPSRLGKALSDTLTRRLIIGVLLLLMVLPAITYNSTDVSHNFGLRQLFWFGRANCGEIGGDFQCDQGTWISEEGWQDQLRQFVSASRPNENSPLVKDVLWLYIPDHRAYGKMREIQNITIARSPDKQIWKALDVVKTIEKEQIPSEQTVDQTDPNAVVPSLLTQAQQDALHLWIYYDKIDTLEVDDAEFMELLNFTDIRNYNELSWDNV